MIFDIVHGTNNSRAKIISPVDLVNFYPEIENGEKSKFVKALIGTPGYSNVYDLGYSGKCRCLYTTSTDKVFSVINDKFVELFIAQTVTFRGLLDTTGSNCVMCDNGTQVLIVDGQYGYIYNMNTEVFAQITDPDFPSNPTHCIFTDGYFIVNSASTGQFYFSSSYDGTAWDALDFATAEYSADTLKAITKTSNGTIWMIGSKSLELWNNVGVANLPWRRIQGTVKEVGTTAPYSVVSNGDNVFWLGSGKNGFGSIYMGFGYDVKRISTNAIEYQIKQVDNINNATAYVYSDEGHSFYVITLSDERTFAYDVNTGEWHVRSTYDGAKGRNRRHFSNWHTFHSGKNYVSSYNSRYIYEMSLDTYDDAGISIKREIVTGHIAYDNKILKHPYFEIDMEKGVGLVGEREPIIMMSFSDNGGRTWSKLVYQLSPGAIGEYKRRAIKRRLGSSRDRVYRLVMTDPVKWVINNAFLEAV